jgi:putative phosphoribosyl transferase
VIYEDRHHAGRVLAMLVKARLARPGRPPSMRAPLVLGLPRGGLPVAAAVAQAIGGELDAFVVRKLGVPTHEELAFGAVASNGVRVLNDDVVHAFLRRGGTHSELDLVEPRERAELARRERAYRGRRPAIDAAGRLVVVVDDGLATGATMRAAERALRAQMPAHLVVAVPVGAGSTCAELEHGGAEVVCAQRLDDLVAVGVWYRDFSQTSDDEVLALLDGGAFSPNVADHQTMR